MIIEPKVPALFDPSKKVSGLPVSFDGDPDPRHRERLYSKPSSIENAEQSLRDRYPLVSAKSLVEGKGTSPLEKRCIAGVMKDGSKTLSQAYAICRSSLQKSGRIEKGGMTLTKLGKKVSASHSRRKDQSAKMKTWKSAVKAARR